VREEQRRCRRSLASAGVWLPHHDSRQIVGCENQNRLFRVPPFLFAEDGNEALNAEVVYAAFAIKRTRAGIIQLWRPGVKKSVATNQVGHFLMRAPH